MDKIRIIGGAPLTGPISVSGAKNAALALMPATLLTDKPVRLMNMPQVADIQSMKGLLAQMGVAVSEGGESWPGAALP